MGLTLDDLYGMEYGTVIDLMTEAANDNCEYKELASQDDFDKF